MTLEISVCYIRYFYQINDCLKLTVWPAELNVHLDPQGNADLINGAYVPTPGKFLPQQPSITEETAIKLALEELQLPDKTKPDKSELIIYAPGHSTRLAWKLEIPVSLATHWLIVIDALTGKLLTKYNQIMETPAKGSGHDLLSQTRTLNLWKEQGVYYMFDTGKPMFDPNSMSGTISVFDMKNQSHQQLSNTDLAWSANPNTGFLPDAVSATFGLSETYDYYFERHGYNSINGQGISLSCAVRVGHNMANAFWNPHTNTAYFGDGLPFAKSLDIAAHEVTHGATSHTADLIYQYQPGAINEAFSDIFGEMVEARTYGTPDWQTGTRLPSHMRDMKNPSALLIHGFNRPYHTPYPSKMNEFIHTDHDNGGVHLNSTIIGHAYYLLAQGLPQAIGINDAEKIFFRVLTIHLTANSQFINVRLAAIRAAEELFGTGSVQALKTAQAFDAVEIFGPTPIPSPTPAPPIIGKDAALFVCTDPGTNTPFLCRRDESLGDNAQGVIISQSGIKPSRISVSRDGQLAVFVNAAYDMCFINTNGQSPETCLNLAGKISSVAISPDKQRYAFVFLNAAMSGGMSSIDLIDAMDFTSDGQWLIYDARNVMSLAHGTNITSWSIYALNLATGHNLIIVPPVPGLDFGNPKLSKTSDNLMTFEVIEHQIGLSIIIAADLNTGALSVTGSAWGGMGFPCYGGNDDSIIYTQRDIATSTGFSIIRQGLANDGLTPVGSPDLWIKDASFAVTYQRIP